MFVCVNLKNNCGDAEGLELGGLVTLKPDRKEGYLVSQASAGVSKILPGAWLLVIDVQ